MQVPLIASIVAAVKCSYPLGFFICSITASPILLISFRKSSSLTGSSSGSVPRAESRAPDTHKALACPHPSDSPDRPCSASGRRSDRHPASHSNTCRAHRARAYAASRKTSASRGGQAHPSAAAPWRHIANCVMRSAIRNAMHRLTAKDRARGIVVDDEPA